MRKYEYLIFATGAVTLALEVLASRIMTPYFGVIPTCTNKHPL
jgi:hypothetical protein